MLVGEFPSALVSACNWRRYGFWSVEVNDLRSSGVDEVAQCLASATVTSIERFSVIQDLRLAWNLVTISQPNLTPAGRRSRVSHAYEDWSEAASKLRSRPSWQYAEPSITTFHLLRSASALVFLIAPPVVTGTLAVRAGDLYRSRRRSVDRFRSSSAFTGDRIGWLAKRQVLIFTLATSWRFDLPDRLLVPSSAAPLSSVPNDPAGAVSRRFSPQAQPL